MLLFSTIIFIWKLFLTPIRNHISYDSWSFYFFAPLKISWLLRESHQKRRFRMTINIIILRQRGMFFLLLDRLAMGIRNGSNLFLRLIFIYYLKVFNLWELGFFLLHHIINYIWLIVNNLFIIIVCFKVPYI